MLLLAICLAVSALLTAWDAALPHDVDLARSVPTHSALLDGLDVHWGGRVVSWWQGLSEILRPLPPHPAASFEGWYHKISHRGLHPLAHGEGSRGTHEAGGKGAWESLAVIPGIVRRGPDPHAFLLIYVDDEWTYSRFPTDSFSFGTGGEAPQALPHPAYELAIGANRFSNAGFTVNVPADNGGRAVRIDAELEDVDTQGGNGGACAWPVDLFAPGAMGWFAYIPTMELFHGIGLLDARVKRLVVETAHEIVDDSDASTNTEGALDSDTKATGRGIRRDVPLTREPQGPGARMYMEKDWGNGGFPTDWIWIQANTWVGSSRIASDELPGCEASLTVSWAKVPLRVGGVTVARIPGFITGLLVRGHLYRFATYTGAKVIKANFQRATESGEPATVELSVEDGHHRLEVSCSAPTSSRTVLWGPTAEMTMDKFVVEHLGGTCSVVLLSRQSPGEPSVLARMGIPYWRSAGEDGGVIFQGTAMGVGMEIMGEDPDAFARALVAMPSLREALASALAAFAALATALASRSPIRSRQGVKDERPPVMTTSSTTIKALSRDLSSISLADVDMMDFDPLPASTTKDKDA